MDGPQPLTLQAARPSLDPQFYFHQVRGGVGSQGGKAGWGRPRGDLYPGLRSLDTGKVAGRAGTPEDMAPGRLTQEEHVPDEHPGGDQRK